MFFDTALLVRFRSEEVEILKAYAKKHGISTSQLIRQGALRFINKAIIEFYDLESFDDAEI